MRGICRHGRREGREGLRVRGVARLIFDGRRCLDFDCVRIIAFAHGSGRTTDNALVNFASLREHCAIHFAALGHAQIFGRQILGTIEQEPQRRLIGWDRLQDGLTLRRTSVIAAVADAQRGIDRNATNSSRQTNPTVRPG